MSSRKETNKWYPPDWDPSMGSVNTYWGEGWRNGSATVNGRAGAAKGITIIRFEMPYNVWCTSCSKMIGKGVRFNAEKNRAGKYYTTTLWSFKMKCHMCDGTITIETDPKNDDYKMVEGVKKKAESWTAASTETIDLPDEAAKAKLASDPMYRLEHGEADKTKARVKKSSLARLLKAKSAVHDYDANAKLRGAFRVKRKQLKAQHAADQALMAKASLYGSQVQLLPESASDKQLAARMTFGGGGGGGGAAIVGRGGRNGAGSAGGARDAIMQQKRAIQKGSIFDARGTVRGGASSSSSGSKTKRIKLESSKSGVTTTTSSTTSSMQSSSRPSTGKLRTNASSSRVQSSGHEVFGGAHGARRGAAGLRALGIGKGIDISSFRLLKSSSRGGIGGEAWAGVGGATNVAEGEMAARLQAGGLVATKRTRRGRKGKAAAAAAAGDGGRGGLSLVDDYSDDPD